MYATEEVPEQSFDEALCDRLYTLRQMSRLRLRDVGSRCGMSLQLINKYEDGRTRVFASRMPPLAAALGVSVTELYGGPEPWLDAELLEFLAAYEGIRSPAQREQFRDLVLTLARCAS